MTESGSEIPGVINALSMLSRSRVQAVLVCQDMLYKPEGIISKGFFILVVSCRVVLCYAVFGLVIASCSVAQDAFIPVGLLAIASRVPGTQVDILNV